MLEFKFSPELMLHFAICGPGVAGTLFMTRIVLEYRKPGSALGMPVGAFIMFGTLFSYVLGIVPATVSGFLLGLLHPRSLLQAIIFSLVICPLVTGACMLAASKLEGSRVQRLDAALLSGLAAPSGIICYLLYFFIAHELFES